MGLFTITDITFNKQDRTGPINQLVENPYQSNLLQYPQDIGSYDKGHYMVFYINKQTRTKFQTTQASGDVPEVLNNPNPTTGSSGIDKTVQKLVGVTNSLLGLGKEIIQKVNNPLLNSSKSTINSLTEPLQKSLKSISFERTIKRTTDAIALYMPDTLNFIQNQGYDSPSISGSNLGRLAVGGASFVDEIKKFDVKNFGQSTGQLVGNLSPFLLNFAAEQFGGDFGRVIFATGFGAVRNPMMEVIYSTPELRTFRYDFVFWPRNSKEAKEVQKILETFRFHQAPEVLGGFNGFFLVPPSEFDIKFYYGGRENPNIPKVSTCVLESVDIDYAPNGWSAYEIPGQNTPTSGGTGMPVGVRLSLQFKETEIVTKDLLRQQNGADIDIRPYRA